MPAAFDPVTPLRNRIIYLLGVDPQIGAMIAARKANVSQIGDLRRYGVHHKPNAGVAADFPVIEVIADDGTDEAYRPSEDWTFGEPEYLTDEGEDRERRLTQNLTVRIVHEALNEEANAALDAKVANAIRSGGMRLGIPSDYAGTAYPWVIGWESRTTRRREWVKEGTRSVTRLTITVYIILYESEQNT